MLLLFDLFFTFIPLHAMKFLQYDDYVKILVIMVILFIENLGIFFYLINIDCLK